MQADNVLKEVNSGMFGCLIGIGRDEVDHFRSPVSNGKNSVVSTTARGPRWQTSDPIHMDGLPTPKGNVKCVDESTGFVPFGFDSLANLTGLNMPFYLGLHRVEVE